MSKSPNDLQRFIHETKKSFIRQSGFEVSITPPRTLISLGKYFEKIQFKAFSVNTPASQLATADEYVEVNEYRKYAYDYSRSIVAISFYIDGDYDIVKLFDAWKNSIIDQRSRSIRFYDEYVAEMYIDVLKKDGSVSAKYKFYEVFPKIINEINYDWSQNQTSVVSITFEFSYYELDNFATFDADAKSRISLDDFTVNDYFDIGALSTDLITAPPGTEGEGELSEEAANIAAIEASGDRAYSFNSTMIDDAVKIPTVIASDPDVDSDQVTDAISKTVDNAAQSQMFTKEQLDEIERSYGIPDSKEAIKEMSTDLSKSSAETKEAAAKVKPSGT